MTDEEKNRWAERLFALAFVLFCIAFVAAAFYWVVHTATPWLADAYIQIQSRRP